MGKKYLALVLCLQLAIVFISCGSDDNTPIEPDIPDIVNCPNSVDYEGKTYSVVKIANQCWFKENLNIGEMLDSTQIASDNGVIEKHCYHDNRANCEKYGGLYSWDEAMIYSKPNDAQGICPNGWHIPTRDDFQILIDSVDRNGNDLLKEDEGIGSTNTSGFSALLSGYFGSNPYVQLKYYGIEETTEFTSSSISTYSMKIWNDGRVEWYHPGSIREFVGLSLRCIMDEANKE